MIDTHLHIDDARYDADRDQVMARAAAAGVERVIIPGVSATQWPTLPALAARHGAAFAVGTHPQNLTWTQAVPDDPTGAVAIGECGLDGPTEVAMEVQEAVLAAHLALARDTGLPVILHCYKAHDRMLPLLRRFAPLRGVVHSYSGGPELVADYVAIGLHLSLAGVVTYDNARKPLNTLRRIPLDRLLVETDGPDQCPRPHRGRNEPAFLPLIVAAMEAHLGHPLADQLDQNARALFGLG